MKERFKIEELKSFLPAHEPFSKEMINNFFVKNGEHLTNENLDVRINRLKSKGIIVGVGRGWWKGNNN